MLIFRLNFSNLQHCKLLDSVSLMDINRLNKRPVKHSCSKCNCWHHLFFLHQLCCLRHYTPEANISDGAELSGGVLQFLLFFLNLLSMKFWLQTDIFRHLFATSRSIWDSKGLVNFYSGYGRVFVISNCYS